MKPGSSASSPQKPSLSRAEVGNGGFHQLTRKLTDPCREELGVKVKGGGTVMWHPLGSALSPNTG